ncbi:fibronectin type III domain-containing protein [Cytophaga sp. FL35]|uniref:fibronectin type III domain-containing protein n=1 Tax=Cytophaga sp. FL35 TaxID=1904456 RepID=UPI001653AEEB|nr:fibronectin type III domain-containing protein [Cytophaga sp. FL35]MBC6997701.1 hypothetical protein [Cytophaga sp. FL35]
MIFKTIKHIIQTLQNRIQQTAKLSAAHCLLQSAICLLFLTFNYTIATAQSFPVQVIPQVTPPPPIYFSEYANESTVNSPLRVQLILNDFEIVNREVRLRVSFEGSGISFQSKDLVTGASPLFLEGGVPLVLTNVELAPYFRYENLNGISGNVYGNAIPEGAYNFCFEVFDVLTGSRLSQKSCAISVVFQNEPPFLVSPRNKTNVEEINPQNIVFQWTPRHVNVSNVEYELSIVEIWDTQVDPQQAFLSSPPVFQTVTNATTYVYGPADPLFLSGKNYAWRVQAKAKQGLEEVGLFENQGYSEIYSFSYAGSCDLPLGINHEVKGSTNANIFWDDFSTDVPEYTLRYRQKNVEGAEWFPAKTTSNILTLWNLKPGTTYEYQLSKKCNTVYSDWSLLKEFTTTLEFEEESVLDCGIAPNISVTNKDPLPNMASGSIFKAGDFPVTVMEVSGSNGRFTGKGFVKMPYLENLKVYVEFTNILVNTDQEMAEGSVRTAYDPTWRNILNTADLAQRAGEFVDAVGDLGESVDDILEDVFNTDDEDEENAPPVDPEMEEGETVPPSTETSGENETDTNTSDASNDADNEESSSGSTSNDSNGSTPNTGGSTGDNSSDNPNPDTNEEDEQEVVIVYNGSEYRNGDILEIKYSNNSSKHLFTLANHAKDCKIDWSTHADMNELAATSFAGSGHQIELNLNNKEYLTLQAEYWTPSDSYPEGESQKIRIVIKILREQFDLKELYAKHSKRRIAKSGQTLYLLDDTGLSESSKFKKVEFGVKIDPKLKESEIHDLNLGWYYGSNKSVSKDEASLNISRNIRLKEGFDNTTVKAGYPKAKEKDINVKWEDQYDVSTDYLTKFSKILTFLEQFNRISSKFKSVLPCEASILNDFNALVGAKKIAFKLRTYNEEDDESRELYDVLQTNLKLQSSSLADLQCGKDLGYLGVSLGKFYGGMSLGANINFRYSLKTKNETLERKTVPEISGGFVLTTDFGFKTAEIIDEYFFLKAAIEIKAGTKTVYPFKGKNYQIGSYLYLGKTNFVVDGYIDTWLTGREDFNFKYLIYDSQWESDQRLIIDLKAQDIYLETGN